MTVQLEASIVRIRAADETIIGTGFLVAQKLVISCAHVVADALGISPNTTDAPTEYIQLDFPLIAPEQKVEGRVVLWKPIYLNNSGDIAGLEIHGILPKGVQPLPLVVTNDFWGHPFRTFGFPSKRDDGVWASGVLRGRQATGWVQIEDLKETGYRVQPGFSGAPVWDEDVGGVVGMAVADEVQPEVKAAFIIPVDILLQADATKTFFSQVQVSENYRRAEKLHNQEVEGKEQAISNHLPSESISNAVALRVSIAIVQKGSEVLFLRRRQREGRLHWQFPAGIVKPRSDPEETAITEVANETGVSCRIVSNIGERVHPDTGVHSIYYHCIYLHGRARNKDQNENAEVRWIKASDVSNYVTSNLFTKVQELLDSISSTPVE